MDWAELYQLLLDDLNDASAWQAISAHVRSWARMQMRGCGDDAIDDAVADVCSSVAVAFHSARGAPTFAGFVYGRFLNERRRAFASRRRHQRSVRLADDLAGPGAGEPSDSGHWAAARLWPALEQLPPRERTAVCLRHLEAKSAEHISVQLGVSVVNARQIVNRGMVHLRARIAPI